MSGTGKFCLVVTLLLLLMAMVPIPSPYGGWTPKLLLVHNQWGEALREAKADVQNKQAEESLARQELQKAAAEIDALAIGWDRVWHVPAGGGNNAPRVQVLNNGNLRLFNIGADQGLAVVQTVDENDNQVALQPVVHAFYVAGEGVSYAGEFKAVNVNPAGAELRPVHLPDQSEVSNWMNHQGGWRLRSIIPSGERARIDEIQKSRIRVRDMIALTQSNIQKQQALLKEAEAALAVRQAELLGNPDPNATDIPGRPEFKEGLLIVTEREEEDRDQLALDVDTLRRNIKSEGEDRDSKVQSLQEAAAALPGASSEYDRVTTPQVAAGQ